jgi:hypothetical protein
VSRGGYTKPRKAKKGLMIMTLKSQIEKLQNKNRNFIISIGWREYSATEALDNGWGDWEIDSFEIYDDGTVNLILG